MHAFDDISNIVNISRTCAWLCFSLVLTLLSLEVANSPLTVAFISFTLLIRINFIIIIIIISIIYYFSCLSRLLI